MINLTAEQKSEIRKEALKSSLQVRGGQPDTLQDVLSDADKIYLWLVQDFNTEGYK